MAAEAATKAKEAEDEILKFEGDAKKVCTVELEKLKYPPPYQTALHYPI